VKIFSDCKSALTILLGRNRGTFFSLLSGWRKKDNIMLEKVKAHPERYRSPENWTHTDRGIWIADQIAGNEQAATHVVKASDWLKKVAYESKAYVTTKQGLPFVKDISKEWGKYMMDKYLKDRDDYRERDGRGRIWEQANLKYLHKVMGKNSSIADRAATQRAGLGKIWRWSRYRDNKTCVACGDRATIGIIHPLRKCKNKEVAAYRERWKNEVSTYIKKLPQTVRAAAEELWRNMEQGAHGEYACCGVYLKSFCEGLTRADVELDKKNKGAIMRLLKIIGKGARETLKVHTGIKEVSRSKSLAQTSIKRYFKRKDNPETVETDIVSESKGLMKRNRKRYKYINPESSESEDEDSEVRIRNPPSAKIIYSNYIKIIKARLTGEEPEYWEWKAG